MSFPPVRPILFYDGGCALCRREIRFYQWLDRKKQVEWLDIHARPQALIAFDLEHEDAMRVLHLRDANGEMQRGVDAFILLWQYLPGGTRLAWLAQRKPIYRLLAWGYARFAKRRYQKRCTTDSGCRLE